MTKREGESNEIFSSLLLAICVVSTSWVRLLFGGIYVYECLTLVDHHWPIKPKYLPDPTDTGHRLLLLRYSIIYWRQTKQKQILSPPSDVFDAISRCVKYYIKCRCNSSLSERFERRMKKTAPLNAENNLLGCCCWWILNVNMGEWRLSHNQFCVRHDIH